MATVAEHSAGVDSIRIRATEYHVEAISPGEDGTAAFRLTKPDGTSYDVIRCHDELIRCDCPHYTMRLEGLSSSNCKHGQALFDLGYFAVPAPAPAPRVLSDVEVRQIRSFGLAWPKGAIAPPAPVKSEIISDPAPVAVAESDAPLATARRSRDAAKALRVLAEERLSDAVAMVAGRIGPEDHARLAAGRERTERALRAEIGGFSLEALPWPSRISFEPTAEDRRLAAAMFASPDGLRDGETAPPIGDRSWPRRRPLARYTTNTLTDADVAPHGVC